MKEIESDHKKIIHLLKNTIFIFDYILNKNNNLLNRFRKEISDSFDEIREIIYDQMKCINKNSILIDDLKKVGLSGRQLNLKIKIFRSLYKSWIKSKTISNLIRLLKWLDIILNSLVYVISILEPVKEYKVCIEQYLQDPKISHLNHGYNK